MIRILLPALTTMAACTPSPQEVATPIFGPVSENTAQGSIEPIPNGQSPADPDAGDAARGPIPEPVSAAGTALPMPTPQEQGRRIVSTAFVRVGPDGYLTVELRDGRVLVLRDVVMRNKVYCGKQVAGERSGAQFCGRYPDVSAARPGGGPFSSGAR
jgi:hypothetical protein